MIRAGAIHMVSAILRAAPEIAAADHNADLNAKRRALFHRVTHCFDHRKIQSGLFCPGERLAADFQ